MRRKDATVSRVFRFARELRERETLRRSRRFAAALDRVEKTLRPPAPKFARGHTIERRVEKAPRSNAPETPDQRVADRLDALLIQNVRDNIPDFDPRLDRKKLQRSEKTPNLRALLRREFERRAASATFDELLVKTPRLR